MWFKKTEPDEGGLFNQGLPAVIPGGVGTVNGSFVKAGFLLLGMLMKAGFRFRDYLR